MHVLDANEIFGMTFYTYDKIMEVGGKNGPDALALYVRLLKQTRIQETNQTWSLNEFLQKSMGWGKDRLQNAKKILNELGLIDYLQTRHDNGRMGTQYIRVNYLIDEQKIRTNGITYDLCVDQLTKKSADGEMETNAYIYNINALSTKDKGLSKSEKIPTASELVEAYKQNPQLVAKVKDESAISLWANYKQKRKSKAYKTVAGFIQQLIEDITTVSYGEIRYDVGDRLRYAYNKAINGDNLGIRRDDKMEKGFATWKKFNSLAQQQNE